MEADVVVIGGGMAGVVAALRAAALGKNVTLIRKGHGASAMSSGTIDIAGPNGFLPMDPWDSLPTISDRLRDIIRSKPLHPYAIIAGGRDDLDRLRLKLGETLDFLDKKLPDAGLEGSGEHNYALPTVVGTVKFCACAPRSLIGGNLLEMSEARLALIGLNALPTFRCQTCKQTMLRYSSLHSPEAIADIDVIEIDVPGLADSPPKEPFEMARYLDDPSAIENLAKTIHEQLKPGTSHVALPPVLGMSNHARAFEIVEKGMEPTVFELISPNFSAHGFRLQLALDRALHENGIRVITQQVIDAERDGRLLRNLLLGEMKTRRTITAKKYIVATGKFSSGGLIADDFLKEPLFGLPIFVRGKRVDEKFVENLLDWDTAAEQDFLSCGIHVDSSLRPLDRFGEPAFENLFAAGALIGEYDYITEKCGFGVAALTGYLAGENATK